VYASGLFVTFIPGKHSVLYVWTGQLYDYARGRPLDLSSHVGSAEYAVWRSDGRRLILGDKETALVIDYPTLRIVESFDRTRCAWWSGNTAARVTFDAEGTQTLRIGTRSSLLPRRVIVTAATEDGSMLLGRVQNPKADAEHRTNAVVLRRRANLDFTVSGKLLPRDGPLTDDPYGDLLVLSPNRKQFLFGMGSITSGEKDYVLAYHYNTATRRATRVNPNLSSYVMPPVAAGGRTFTGIYRQETHRVNAPPVPPRYYRFTVRQGRVTARRLDFDALAFAASKHGEDTAYLYRKNNRFYLDLHRRGRRVVHEELRATGEPVRWRAMQRLASAG
jgi:hypothetical protein